MILFFFFFKQKTAYEVRISDWSSDVCSNDAAVGRNLARIAAAEIEYACAACDLVSGAAEPRFRSQIDEQIADIEVNRVVQVQDRPVERNESPDSLEPCLQGPHSRGVLRNAVHGVTPALKRSASPSAAA